VFRCLGERYGEATALDSLGFAHQRLGDHDEVIAQYRGALDIFRDLKDRCGQVETLIKLGEVYQATGQLDAAHQTWDEARPLALDLVHPDADQLRAQLAKAVPRAGDGFREEDHGLARGRR
jgi:tetratricopeptide (TPR) repeat protein